MPVPRDRAAQEPERHLQLLGRSTSALIDGTGNLDDTKKSTAEYWADGPGSVFPPGHTAMFAQALSRKKGHSLDTDAKMFFMLGNAMMDASIASWYQKYKYDFVRPITAIRYALPGADKMVNSWLGPNQGYGMVPGSQWMPYQALNVVTPPFPEYVSGHSHVQRGWGVHPERRSAAAATPSGHTSIIPAGSSKFESNTPIADVKLSWPTFTARVLTRPAMSRRYGGIHFKTGDYPRPLSGQAGRLGSAARARPTSTAARAPRSGEVRSGDWPASAGPAT